MAAVDATGLDARHVSACSGMRRAAEPAEIIGVQLPGTLKITIVQEAPSELMIRIAAASALAPRLYILLSPSSALASPSSYPEHREGVMKRAASRPLICPAARPARAGSWPPRERGGGGLWPLGPRIASTCAPRRNPPVITQMAATTLHYTTPRT